MRYKTLYATFILLLVAAFIKNNIANAQETYFGYVNCQNLLLLHPLIQQYDVHTKRIKYTASYPKTSENVSEYIDRLNIKKNELLSQIASLDKEFSSKILGKSLVAQKQRFIFWKRREGLKVQCDLIDAAIKQTERDGDYYLNMPTESALFPAAKAIDTSILDAVDYLRKKYNINTIFDSSVFIRYSTGRYSEIAGNYKKTISNLWNGQNISKETINNTALTVFENISKRFPKLKHKPFLAGAINLSKEAEDLVYNISLRDN